MIFSASRNHTSHSELELPELVCKALALAHPISDNVALFPEVNTDVLAHLLLILCFAQEWIKESNSQEVREYHNVQYVTWITHRKRLLWNVRSACEAMFIWLHVGTYVQKLKMKVLDILYSWKICDFHNLAKFAKFLFSEMFRLNHARMILNKIVKFCLQRPWKFLPQNFPPIWYTVAFERSVRNATTHHHNNSLGTFATYLYIDIIDTISKACSLYKQLHVCTWVSPFLDEFLHNSFLCEIVQKNWERPCRYLYLTALEGLGTL